MNGSGAANVIDRKTGNGSNVDSVAATTQAGARLQAVKTLGIVIIIIIFCLLIS